MAAAVLSHRYIADRFLPDKAIDLVDESAARIRMQMESKPQELDDVDRRITQLEIDRVSIARDDDPASRERLARLDAELAELKEKSAALTRPLAGREGRHGPAHQREEADRRGTPGARRGAARRRLEPRRRAAARRAAAARARARGAGSARRRQPAKRPMVRNEVDEEDIAAVVAKWTGIPVTRLLEGEVQKLVKMEERLATARDRPGRSDPRGRQRRPPRPRRPVRSRTGRSARSSSSARPASARPSSRARSRSSCSTTSAP